MSQIGPVAPKQALDLPSALAYVYAPILPFPKRLKRRLGIRRQATRNFNPRDVLLPAGYVTEVVATGFNAPVHCTFDDHGACYVVEGGHKIEVRPRIL